MNCIASTLRMQIQGQSTRVGTVNKQWSFPPRNRTFDARCRALTLLVTEQWRNGRNVRHGFRRKRLACREVLFIPRRPRVVGCKDACRSEAVAQLPEIPGACQNVVARIKRIEAKLMASAELNPSARHELHQPHRAARRDCMLVACAFNLDSRTDPACRTVKRVDASAMKLANRSMD
jgi:hypothetical protein